MFALMKLEGIVVRFRWISFAKIKSLNLVFQHNLWHRSITHWVELRFPNWHSVGTELSIHFDFTVICWSQSGSVLCSGFKDFIGQRELTDTGVDWACCTNRFIGWTKSYLPQSSLFLEKEGERNPILATQCPVSSLDYMRFKGPIMFDVLFVTIKYK